MAQFRFADRYPKITNAVNGRLKWLMILVVLVGAGFLIYGGVNKQNVANQQARAVMKHETGGSVEPGASNLNEVHNNPPKPPPLVAWVASKTYAINDIAYDPFTNATYRAIQPHVAAGANLAADNPNGANWQIAGNVTAMGVTPVAVAPPSPASPAPAPPQFQLPMSMQQPMAPAVTEDPIAKEAAAYRAKLLQLRHEAELQPLGDRSGIGGTPSIGSSDPVQAQIDQLEKARSTAMASLASARTMQPQLPTMSGGMPGNGFGAESPNGPAGGTEDVDPNGQRNKQQFENAGSAGIGGYNRAVRTAPISRWVLQPPDKIPCTLDTSTVSDLPGDISCTVSRDVFDSPTHTQVLIPIHSRIVGSYNSVISYGQGNVQESWQYIWFPDGTTLDLDKFPGLNADGSTGLRDKTDNHIKRLVGGVLLSAIFSAGVEIGQKGNAVGAYPSTGNLLGAGVSQAAGRAGDQITQRNLNVQPTLNIRPGKQFAVEVKKTLVFVNGPYLPFDFGK